MTDYERVCAEGGHSFRGPLVRGLCPMHYMRLRRHGDPSTVIPVSERKHRRSPDHPRWVDRPTYRAAQARVVAQRGKADTHACGRCDRPAWAWAYDGTDPVAITDDQGRTYSADPDRYLPLCGSCWAHHAAGTPCEVLS